MSPGARFEALYRDTFTDVYAYCRRRVHPPSDVDDVVSEVYATVWRRIDDASAAETPLAWIYSVAYRTIANSRRSKQRRLRLVERARHARDTRLPTDPATDAVEGQAGRMLEQRFTAELANLGDVDREIVLLSTWEQLSQDEIAAVVGVSTKAVRTRLYRARQQLKRTIDRDKGEEPDTESSQQGRDPRTPGQQKGEDA